jgi:hypothetical protein
MFIVPYRNQSITLDATRSTAHSNKSTEDRNIKVVHEYAIHNHHSIYRHYHKLAIWLLWCECTGNMISRTAYCLFLLCESCLWITETRWQYCGLLHKKFQVEWTAREIWTGQLISKHAGCQTILVSAGGPDQQFYQTFHLITVSATTLLKTYLQLCRNLASDVASCHTAARPLQLPQPYLHITRWLLSGYQDTQILHVMYVKL